jgi:Mrp family chromosome partitioning ATPase
MKLPEQSNGEGVARRIVTSLLDIDIHGPSVPKLLQLDGTMAASNDNVLQPVQLGFGSGTLSVMSNDEQDTREKGVCIGQRGSIRARLQHPLPAGRG